MGPASIIVLLWHLLVASEATTGCFSPNKGLNRLFSIDWFSSVGAAARKISILKLVKYLAFKVFHKNNTNVILTVASRKKVYCLARVSRLQPLWGGLGWQQCYFYPDVRETEDKIMSGTVAKHLHKVGGNRAKQTQRSCRCGSWAADDNPTNQSVVWARTGLVMHFSSGQSITKKTTTTELRTWSTSSSEPIWVTVYIEDFRHLIRRPN